MRKSLWPANSRALCIVAPLRIASLIARACKGLRAKGNSATRPPDTCLMVLRPVPISASQLATACHYSLLPMQTLTQGDCRPRTYCGQARMDRQDAEVRYLLQSNQFKCMALSSPALSGPDIKVVEVFGEQ